MRIQSTGTASERCSTTKRAEIASANNCQGGCRIGTVAAMAGPRATISPLRSGAPRVRREGRNPGAAQGGFTFVGWLLILALLGVVVLLVLRLGPVYLEQWTVSSIVSNVAEDPQLSDAGVQDVQRAVHNFNGAIYTSAEAPWVCQSYRRCNTCLRAGLPAKRGTRTRDRRRR